MPATGGVPLGVLTMRSRRLFVSGARLNVALARRMDPDISSRFKEIIIMGGNIRGVGNMDIAAEFNFWMDPEAAQVVLREYKCPLKVVPWEVCQEHGLEWDFFTSWLSVDTPNARFVRNITYNLTQTLQHAKPPLPWTTP
ncbi:hypothetical protein Bbelb_271610 [Branchiostoma belcheri]|nr:hypothetical protein Bbelb_271610 [Branchiostoma belcheri]